jgi:hypothetical protein
MYLDKKWNMPDFNSMYTSNKVLQVCVITALKIKRYKRKNYSFVIILNIIRLMQNKAAWYQHVLWAVHWKPADSMEFPCTPQRVQKHQCTEKEELCGNSSYKIISSARFAQNMIW